MTQPTMPNAYPAGVGDTAPASLHPALLTALAATGADVSATGDDRADHGRDWWPLTIGGVAQGVVPVWPSAVVRPHTTDEVAAVLMVAREHRVAVTPQGGRSGVVGGAVPTAGGIALDLTAMDQILFIDPVAGRARAQAGVFGPDFEKALREQGQTAGHFPQSFDLATVGGWMATRGAGQYSNRYGNATDIVRGLTIVLASGDIVQLGGRSPRESVGPDLVQLFVGSEGTLGVITEVEVVTRDVAPFERRAAYLFPTFEAGLEACRLMARADVLPAVARLYDAIETPRSLKLEGGCGLILLDEGQNSVVNARMDLAESLCATLGTVTDDTCVGTWLGHRNDVGALAPLWERGYVVDTIEVAGTWPQLPVLFDKVVSALNAIPGIRNASCHQSHAYHDGACLYFTFAGQPEGDAAAFYRSAWDAASQAVIAAGGSLSHHHGVGRNRASYLRDALGSGFTVLAELKKALDPSGLLNPGVLDLP